MRIILSVLVLCVFITSSWAAPNEFVAFACPLFKGMFNGECSAVDGSWGSWGPYSNCSSSCTGGTRIRTRSCDNPTASNGGSECPNIITDSTETEDCNSDIPCPVHGGWGTWGEFSVCTKTCGNGTWTRQRLCDNPTPANGGDTCPDDLSVEKERCAENPCPVNGSWGQWSSFSECSTTCGGGTRNRTRVCDDPPPSNGGTDCPPPSVEIQQCNNETCLVAVCMLKSYKYDENTGICIQLITISKNFEDANKTCVDDGAFLFKMDETDKMNFAIDIIEDRQANADGGYYIGAQLTEDGHRWLDGSRVTWIGTEPTNTDKPCVKLKKGKMGEANCATEKYFFCQITV